eukprot:1709295-Pleurochrysis_carterae.AAC.2
MHIMPKSKYQSAPYALAGSNISPIAPMTSAVDARCARLRRRRRRSGCCRSQPCECGCRPARRAVRKRTRSGGRSRVPWKATQASHTTVREVERRV